MNGNSEPDPKYIVIMHMRGDIRTMEKKDFNFSQCMRFVSWQKGELEWRVNFEMNPPPRKAAIEQWKRFAQKSSEIVYGWWAGIQNLTLKAP